MLAWPHKASSFPRKESRELLFQKLADGHDFDAEIVLQVQKMRMSTTTRILFLLMSMAVDLGDNLIERHFIL